MERTQFIINLYSRFILTYLLLRFFRMYILGYGVVIITKSFNKGILHNPFVTEILEDTNKIQDIENQYFIKYKERNTIKQKEINKSSYLKYNQLDLKNDTYTIDFNNGKSLNTKDVIDIFEKDNRTYSKNFKKKELSQHRKNQKHIEHIKNIYSDLIFLGCMIFGLFIYTYKKYKKTHDIYLLPYDHNIFHNFGSEEKQVKQYRYFKKQNKNGDLIYTNKLKSIYEDIKHQENDIEQYLQLEDIEIERLGKKEVIIRDSSIPRMLNFNKEKYKKGKLFYGKSKLGKDIYIDLDNLNHTILIGTSGFGKSVNVQNFLNNCFFNIEEFDTIYLVDFKRVEFSRYQNLHDKVKVINDLEKFCEVVKELDEKMEERYQEREKITGTANYIGKKEIMVIDEFRDIENVLKLSNEDLYEENNKRLLKILRKRRRSSIFLVFSGQRRTKQEINPSIINNIQTYMLMGSDDTYSISTIRGVNEYLETYNLNQQKFKRFKKGRVFYRNTLSGERFQIQSPYFDVNDDEQLKFMFRLLDLKEEIIEKKIHRVKFINNLIKQYEKKELSKENLLIEIKKYDKKTDIQVITEPKKEDDNLEERRLKLWELSKNMEELKGKEIRKKLYKVKQLVKNNDNEKRKNLITDIEKTLH